MKRIILCIFLVFSVVIINAQSSIVWDMPMNISNNTFGNMHPRMALDGSGNPLVVWGKMNDESVMFSRWNGSMFTTPIKLNPPWMTVASAGWMGPDIASFGDTVYVVVKRTPEVSDTNRIFIFTSFNGGVSFNTPVELAFIADSLSRFPTVTTDISGNPIVAFMKFNSSFLDSRWVVSKSTDYGATFMTDVKASGWGGSAEVCDCCPGALVSAGTTYAMLYRDNNSNIRDTWAGISSNSAISFTSGIEVDNNNWMIMSCPSSGPDGIIIGDTLYSTHMSAGSGNYRTYLSKSSLSSGMMTAITNLTGSVPGLSQQNYPRISGDGNAIAITWKQTINGAAQLPILFTNDVTNGFPSTYDTVDLGDITNTDIQIMNGNIWVVWQDDNSGTVKFRHGTYQLNTSTAEIENNKFSLFPNPATSSIIIKTHSGSLARIKIYNALSEIVYFKDDILENSIDISFLKNGLYSIQIMTDTTSVIQKFIKQ